MAQPYAKQGKEYVQHGQNLGKYNRIGIEMAHGRAKADGVIQHDALVDEKHTAGTKQQPENTLVAVEGISHGKEEQCREQVALVHFNAENIQQQENHRAAQGEHIQLAASDKHGDDQRKCHGHGQYAKESPGAACETKDDICQ